jgi:hypothetical protein
MRNLPVVSFFGFRKPGGPLFVMTTRNLGLLCERAAAVTTARESPLIAAARRLDAGLARWWGCGSPPVNGSGQAQQSLRAAFDLVDSKNRADIHGSIAASEARELQFLLIWYRNKREQLNRIVVNPAYDVLDVAETRSSLRCARR